MDFCTGRITTSQLYERGNMVLDKMPDDPVKNRIYDLMKLHLSILEGKGDLEEKIPEDASKEPSFDRAGICLVSSWHFMIRKKKRS